MLVAGAIAIGALVLIARRPALVASGAPDETDPMPRAAAAAAGSARVPAGGSPGTSEPQPLPEMSDDHPFAQMRPELERRAQAGDAVAARRLGMVLATCNRYEPL